MQQADMRNYPPFVNRLADKVAIVTGGGSGLGAAIAGRFDAEGALVVVADVDVDAAKQTASTLANGYAAQLDVRDEQQWIELIGWVEAHHGRLDILVNNAGITTMGSVEELTLEAFKHELDVDVIGVFLGCKYGIGLMKKGGAGSIINMSSSAGLRADADLCAYNAAKSAVTLMSKSVALHCAREGYGIRCNSLHPGAIHTPIIDKVLAQVPNPEETLAHFVASHPIGHLGRAADIAAMAAFLAADESQFATGAAFSVDGGNTAQ